LDGVTGDSRSPCGRADRAGHGLHHLEQETHAVLDGAAVGVAAVVDAVAQELVDEVAVGAVHLDAVETGLDGVSRGAAVLLDDARDLRRGQRARRRARAKPPAMKVLLAAGRDVLDTGACPPAAATHAKCARRATAAPRRGRRERAPHRDAPPAGHLLGAVDAGASR